MVISFIARGPLAGASVPLAVDLHARGLKKIDFVFGPPLQGCRAAMRLDEDGLDQQDP